MNKFGKVVEIDVVVFPEIGEAQALSLLTSSGMRIMAPLDNEHWPERVVSLVVELHSLLQQAMDD